jgi:hypothetical protein
MGEDNAYPHVEMSTFLNDNEILVLISGCYYIFNNNGKF